MPFKSEAQRRLFYAKADSGEIPMSTVKKWESHTPKGKLPEKVKKAELVSFFAELDNLMDKEANLRGEVSKRLGSYWENLLGKNVQRAIQKGEERVMAHPIVAEQAQWGEKPIRGYVKDVLKGDKAHIHPWTKGKIVPYDPTNPYATTSHDVSELLWKNRNLVKNQQQHTKKTRLLTGAAAAVPLAGSAATVMSKEGAEPPKKKSTLEKVAPVAAGVGVGSIPISKGIAEGNLLPRPANARGPRLTLDQLGKSMQSGDILMTGAREGSPIHMALGGGDPRASHAEVITGVPEAGKYNRVHSMGGLKRGGKALPGANVPLVPEGHYVLRRPKNPELAKSMVGGVQEATMQEEALHRAFGPHARSTQYEKSLQRNSALRNLLPKSLRNLLPESKCLGGICSTLPAEAAPGLVPGQRAKDVLPSHLISTPTMETIGHFSPELTRRERRILALKGAAPWLLRGAAGLGLGYGAYRGVKKLLEDKTASAKIAFSPEDASRVAGLAKRLIRKEPIANLIGPAYIQKALDPSAASLAGKIIYPPKRGAIGYLKNMGGPEVSKALSKLSPKDKKMFEQLGLSHEMAERKFSRSGIKGLKSENLEHAPGVIPVEHNMLSTMEPGNAGVKKVQKLLRKDDPAAQAFNKATGGRIQFGEGPRLSRHARKHITELMHPVTT